MTIWEGHLYFSNEAPHIIGHLVIGSDSYEIVGVKRSAIRADITVRQITEQANDDGRNGDSQRDPS